MAQPSQFMKHPYDSVFANFEKEVVARNIMVILKRTGDTFRELSWEEYRTERLKDKGFHESEIVAFDSVVGYTITEENARQFSLEWKEANAPRHEIHG